MMIKIVLEKFSEVEIEKNSFRDSFHYNIKIQLDLEIHSKDTLTKIL